MGYRTPPTLSNSVIQSVNSFKATVLANYDALSTSMISGALSAAGITTPKISASQLAKLITGTIVPITHHWEGGWSDHPNDSGGATMRGVILTTFRDTFNKIFKNRGIQQLDNAVANIDANLAGWRSNNQIGKQFLYQLLSDQKVSSLWVLYFFCSSSNRYPIAIASEDPYLGFLLYDLCWGSGAGMYKSNKINQLATEYGWSGSNFARFIVGLGDKTPEFATKVLQRRMNFILDISKPGSKNSVFRNGWLNRLIKAPNSQVDSLVIINENFNLNAKGIYAFTQQEKNHLARKAAIYKTIKLDFPNLA